MSTLETILLILLVLNAIALGALVLLQQGKGADIGAAFGSGAASAVFGGAGSASFLAKLTAWLAMGFFLLSLGLAFTAKERAANLERRRHSRGDGSGRAARDDATGAARRAAAAVRCELAEARSAGSEVDSPGQTSRFRRSRRLIGSSFQPSRSGEIGIHATLRW